MDIRGWVKDCQRIAFCFLNFLHMSFLKPSKYLYASWYYIKLLFVY
ncbi:hypothetical protein NEISICOT_03497 [Neisseria sicca ATCC 29256]|uniref:Uncharacterized protein n=1 Tax=Neisseria sicca ATCC 29256 TaxID=547045 RepID=C6MAB5_NEISI|nr:hypothetical protein NEISICOT_03497 [Neisseria sicca ATCC 29256]